MKNEKVMFIYYCFKSASFVSKVFNATFMAFSQRYLHYFSPWCSLHTHMLWESEVRPPNLVLAVTKITWFYLVSSIYLTSNKIIKLFDLQWFSIMVFKVMDFLTRNALKENTYKLHAIAHSPYCLQFIMLFLAQNFQFSKYDGIHSNHTFSIF